MTTYYVGKGGSDGNNGTTWTLRKLTLNGAEDIPVVANDDVIVGPGIFREQLTCDVSGSSGQPIEYIADVTGRQTDGIGGPVVISASDNDQTHTRSYCVNGVTYSYRTFRGFHYHGATIASVYANGGTNWIVEDFGFVGYDINVDSHDNILVEGNTQADWIIRRGVFFGVSWRHIATLGTSAQDNVNHLVENCLFISSQLDAWTNDYLGSCTMKNCTIIGSGDDGYHQRQAQNASQEALIYNNIFFNCNGNGIESVTTGLIIEDYNLFVNCRTNTNNLTPGANSQDYMTLFELPLIIDGFMMPWNFGALVQESEGFQWGGTSTPTDDLFGITRPTTVAKRSIGAIQQHYKNRETTTKRTGVASIKIDDAGDVYMWMPVDGTQITVSCYTYREANYAGTNPQMIIRQEGVADRTTTDAAAASQWNQLTDTFTPGSGTDWIVVILRSNNTATSGSYGTFFDDLGVS